MISTTDVTGLDATSVFNTYYRRIDRYILSMIHDPLQADDLAQETFLHANRARDSLRDPGALGTWLYRIATHVSLDWLRKQAREASTELEADLAEIEISEDDTPSLLTTVERKEMSTCVQHYVDQLSDSYRAVIILHDLEGLTAPEIAGLLDISLGSVKIRLHRARCRLRAMLEAHCAFSRDERGVLICDPRP